MDRMTLKTALAKAVSDARVKLPAGALDRLTDLVSADNATMRAIENATPDVLAREMRASVLRVFRTLTVPGVLR